MARLLNALVAVLPLFLTACQSPARMEAERRAEAARSCAETGFRNGTDDYRICLLLQRLSDRLGAVEQRLDLIDLEIRRLETFDGRCHGCP